MRNTQYNVNKKTHTHIKIRIQNQGRNTMMIMTTTTTLTIQPPSTITIMCAYKYIVENYQMARQRTEEYLENIKHKRSHLTCVLKRITWKCCRCCDWNVFTRYEYMPPYVLLYLTGAIVCMGGCFFCLFYVHEIHFFHRWNAVSPYIHGA